MTRKPKVQEERRVAKDRRQKGLIEQVQSVLQSGTGKILISALGVLVVVFGVLFDDRIRDNRADIEVIQSQVETVKADMADLQEEVETIQRGVSKASRSLAHVGQLIEDLSKIREELIDAVNGPPRNR